MAEAKRGLVPAWIFLVAAPFAFALAAQASDGCNSAPLQSFQVKADHFGRLSMPLTVDGKTTDALICTSCQWSALAEPFLRQNGLDIRKGDSRFGNWDGTGNTRNLSFAK